MISEFLTKFLALIWLPLLAVLPSAPSAHVPAPAKNTAKAISAVNVKAPDFVLVNQDNQSFDSTQLRGKIVVMNFIFTTCTDVCPLFTVNLAELQRKLKARYADEVFFISVTTDPEVDSPKHLKGYAERHRADFKNWAFLTGSESQLKGVWNGFGVRVIKKGRGLVQHTSLTTVIDRQGIRRMNYLGEKWHVKDLERDLLTLLGKKA
jgi:protein SCO1/2